MPEVLAASDDVLVLAWVDGGRGSDDAERLGRMLATLHGAGAEGFGVLAPGTPGGERAPLRLGPLEIPSNEAADWPAFYAASRVMPWPRGRGCPPTAWPRSSGCASGWPTSRARPSHRRACTATCGAAT